MTDFLPEQVFAKQPKGASTVTRGVDVMRGVHVYRSKNILTKCIKCHKTALQTWGKPCEDKVARDA